jgi:hypothetical protein
MRSGGNSLANAAMVVPPDLVPAPDAYSCVALPHTLTATLQLVGSASHVYRR